MKHVSWAGVGLAALLGSGSAFPTHAAQTVNPNFATSCTAQGGMPGSINVITDFDNGTFGSESGAPNQSPDTDPYPATVTGGVYDNFYAINHGDYSYVANPVTPRNRFQHAEVTDPVYGATGRFFASDPNIDTPTMTFQITNVVPFENYEISFWAANSEPNGTPNRVNAVVDGIVSYSTGLLQPVPSALPWQKYGFVFNAGNRTTIQLAMASTETGSGGRDFYIDNVEMRACTLSQPGSITGTIYIDDNSNDGFDSGTEAGLPDIDVQLFDTQGNADPADDIYISVTTSDASGQYAFTNLAPNPDYEVRVLTNDPDRPSGATIGTAANLSAPVTNGGTASGRDFGFDLSDALLQAEKTVRPLGTDGYALPGTDVEYTITVRNRGDGAAATDSLFLVDTLPTELAFNAQALGGGTPDPVAFDQNGAALDWDYTRDVGYAQAGPPPANFSACSYTPSGTVDASVAYVCFAPDGAMAGGSPDPSFAVSFRMRIP